MSDVAIGAASARFSSIPPGGFPDFDALSDDALDELPYGVIGLSADSKVLRYNLAEGRLARLDPLTVVGRAFFVDVAPCTATPEFQGRVARFLSGERGPEVESFAYLFDFKFGAQEVRVELVRGRGLVYLVVNRTRFLRTRSAEGERLFAPRQTELAPDERALGVVRDEESIRRVAMSPALLSALRSTWDRMAPRAWGLFTFEWGFQWGRRLVLDLESRTLVEQSTSLRELSLGDACEALRGQLAAEGWGFLSVDGSHARSKGAFVLTLQRNAVAEATGPSREPRCHLVAGAMTAFFDHLGARRTHVRELRCGACEPGVPCTFVCVAHERSRELDAALAAPAGSPTRALPEVLERFAARGGAEVAVTVTGGAP